MKVDETCSKRNEQGDIVVSCSCDLPGDIQWGSLGIAHQTRVKATWIHKRKSDKIMTTNGSGTIHLGAFVTVLGDAACLPNEER